MTTIKAVILDDEPDSVTLLHLNLMRHCPLISTITSFTDPTKALDEIPAIKPDLLFLDIEMPGMDGFELLERLIPISFQVIFVTAYNQYAVKAFRMNALDYLVKPIDSNDLIQAVNKSALTPKPIIEQFDLAKGQMKGDLVKKIAIHSLGGISFVMLDEIVFAEASNNYTKLKMENGKDILISKTLKDVQEVLEDLHFLRVHRQYIVNLNQVKTFSRNESVLTMMNMAELPVARNQKEKLMDRYKSI